MICDRIVVGIRDNKQRISKDVIRTWSDIEKSHWFSSLVCRVESGSDDPNYLGHLGHFFDGSSGSHPQIKLSECDQDF